MEMPTRATKRVRCDDKSDEELSLEFFKFENSNASDIDDRNTTMNSDNESGSEQEYKFCEIAKQQLLVEDVTLDDPLQEQPKSVATCNGPEVYYGKNRFKWYSESQETLQTAGNNILFQLPELNPSLNVKLEDAPTEISVWNLLFSDEILQIIVTWTNVTIRRERLNYRNKCDLQDTDVIELKAFLGLLLYTAVLKSNRENIQTLFAADGSGRDIFRSVTSHKRFSFLLVCLRFDNPEDRQVRVGDDPTAPISEVFEKFITRCQAVYSLGVCGCVDEMLVAFRGSCKFKVYMPRKLTKHGLKIMCLTDAKNSYFYNGFIYSGKNSYGKTLMENELNLSKPTQAVLRVTKPVYETNINITAGNRFSSIELVTVLKEKGLSYVGALRKNKEEIPSHFLPNKKRAAGSAVYGFSKDLTLLSYTAKKRETFLLISSLHHRKSSNEETRRPEILTWYNNTKRAVDMLDEKCAKYCSSRRTQRWSMAIFFRVLDISSVNAHILFQLYNNCLLDRSKFIKALARQLVIPHMKRRLLNIRLAQELQLSIKRILGHEETKGAVINIETEERLQVRKTCRRCDPKKKRKTQYVCISCKTPICLECCRKMCVQCASNM